MEWKTNIISQIKTRKDHCNIYEQIIAHCKEVFSERFFDRIFLNFLDNHLLETNLALQTQNAKLNHDVEHLRLANVGLEKASEAR